MRRGHGIAGLQQKAQVNERYRQEGGQLKEQSLQAMREHMAQFKGKLEEFAAKHRSDIRKDAAFRAQFHAMCANIGVDPLASNKGIWAELLGIGDFYYELAVQIVEACWATRAHNGGLIALPALLAYVSRRRGSVTEPISEDDVKTAIKKLKVLANGFDLVTIGKALYVRSVPGELNMDKNEALRVAQETAGGGGVSRSALCSRTGWAESRAQSTLDALLKEGLAMVDDQDPAGATLYWFPCVSGFGAAPGGAAR